MIDLVLTLRSTNKKRIYLSSENVISVQERRVEGMDFRQVRMSDGNDYAVSESLVEILKRINKNE